MRKERKTDLPPSNTRRWTMYRKAAVLEALRSGRLTVSEAAEHYCLSVEELRSWERDFERYGVRGLRTTRVRIYRAVGDKT